MKIGKGIHDNMSMAILKHFSIEGLLFSLFEISDFMFLINRIKV